jgi:mRNA-degrading endonuclease toxin of MazEF toxin-antitoxin module
VSIPDGSDVTGVVMVEQVKSIDLSSRGVKRTAPEQVRQ